MQEGSIVDATIIAAPTSTKNQAGKRDPDRHQTKKGNEWHFGMKMHIGVDESLGLIHSLTTTPANVHDMTQADQYHDFSRVALVIQDSPIKIPVFGLLKRGGKVYTKIIPDASSATLFPIIERKVIPDSIVYSDCWRGYNVLDVSEFKHDRINHSKLFADTQNHINGIENFWNQAKRHMRKFNGVPKEHFGLFLKECERRFNNSAPSAQ